MYAPISRKAQYIRWTLLVLLLISAVVVYVVPAAVGGGDTNTLSVTFLDIGQGDSIFIQSPTGVQMLIDGGPPGGGVLARLSERMGFFDRSIDIVLATHPDQDHIGGLPLVLERYDISEILMTENKSITSADKAFADAAKSEVQAEDARIVYVRRGMQFDLGGGALLTILFPDRDPTFLESNTSSIVARLTYGESEFLFTGDSPQAIEKYLVSLDGNKLQSDVLKVGHHGSRTSSSQVFLDAVYPKYAVISAGKNNTYGHPHMEVMDALRAMDVQTENTATQGSITFHSNGRELWQED